MSRSLPLLPLPVTDCSQAPPFPTDGAWYPLSLVSELQAKLNRTRLVTLRADRSEASGAEVRVRIAEVGPVKDISELGIEPHGQLLVEFEDLEYPRVFVVGRGATHRSVGTRRVAKLIRARISPSAGVEIIHGERIKEATVRGYGALAFHAIGPLLSVEYQATEIVVHENVQRPPALVT